MERRGRFIRLLGSGWTSAVICRGTYAGNGARTGANNCCGLAGNVFMSLAKTKRLTTL